MATTEVVCDAGPLIHLDEIDSLDLLADFEAVIVPEAVWAEVQRHRPAAWEHSDVHLQRVEVGQPDVQLETLVRALSLDAGETEALILMAQHPEALFLTDDAAARLTAEQLGYRVHGTIGVLIRAIRRGQRKPAEVVKLLREIPHRSTLFIRPALLHDIIRQVEDEFGLRPPTNA
jgi:predicted nucleic acid-binding protein